MSTAMHPASPCAASAHPVNELATAQLFATAENALSVALFSVLRNGVAWKDGVRERGGRARRHPLRPPQA